jgi:ribosomal protein S24E
METKIIEEKKNPFLERTEIALEIKSDAAPSAEEVKTEIGKDAELTVIKKINTNFGRQTFVVEAVVYDNAEAKEKVETVPQKVRKKMEADKKAAEEEAAKAAEAEKKTAEEAKAAEAEAPKEEVSAEEPVAEEKAEEASE